MKIIFRVWLGHCPTHKHEGEGFMTCTTAKHQGALRYFDLTFGELSCCLSFYKGTPETRLHNVVVLLKENVLINNNVSAIRF